MLYIKKVRLDYAIDFAAEELKKYLRMMMPQVLEVEITYEPEAKDGFRLGLLEDFGLPCEVAEPMYDDVVHIDTDTEGGILAGSNPRSVLFAVYRFLKKQGCIWLFPGSDGEKIPMVRELKPVDYLHKAPLRYRGQCNEGASVVLQLVVGAAVVKKLVRCGGAAVKGARLVIHAHMHVLAAGEAALPQVIAVP